MLHPDEERLVADGLLCGISCHDIPSHVTPCIQKAALQERSQEAIVLYDPLHQTVYLFRLSFEHTLLLGEHTLLLCNAELDNFALFRCRIIRFLYCHQPRGTA